MDKEKNSPLLIGDTYIQPGERITLALPTPELYTFAPIYIPIHIVHGKKSGPCLLVCAAIHGDETNGIVIIQRLLKLGLLKKIQGTLIAIPVINIYGLITQTRNLPDRRDLDNSFPGSETGSFASRLAFLLSKQILNKATHLIDIHTGEPHNYRFPQILTNTHDEEALFMASSFQVPIILHSESKRGMLWKMYEPAKVPTLIYEGGEAHRINEMVIKTGIKGIVRVMHNLGMVKLPTKPKRHIEPLIFKSTIWIRSPGSGICQLFKKPGAYIYKNEPLAAIFDPFGTGKKHQINSPTEGIIIGTNELPITNEGEPIVHIAISKKAEDILAPWREGEIFEEH